MPWFISKIWLKYIYVYLYKNPYSEVYIFIDYISVSLHSKDREGGAKYILDDDDNVANIMDVEVWNCSKMLINLFIWLLNVNVKNDVRFRFTSSQLISIHLNSSQFISSQLISIHLKSSHLNSSQLISTHLNSSRLISTHLNSSQLISNHLNSFQLISSHFNSWKLINQSLFTSKNIPRCQLN